LLGVDHFQQGEIAGHEVDKLKPGITVNKDGGRGSGGKNVIFSNGPNYTSECSKLLY
jgi:hypothetical protein